MSKRASKPLTLASLKPPATFTADAGPTISSCVIDDILAASRRLEEWKADNDAGLIDAVRKITGKDTGFTPATHILIFHPTDLPSIASENLPECIRTSKAMSRGSVLVMRRAFVQEYVYPQRIPPFHVSME